MEGEESDNKSSKKVIQKITMSMTHMVSLQKIIVSKSCQCRVIGDISVFTTNSFPPSAVRLRCYSNCFGLSVETPKDSRKVPGFWLE